MIEAVNIQRKNSGENSLAFTMSENHLIHSDYIVCKVLQNDKKRYGLIENKNLISVSLSDESRFSS